MKVYLVIMITLIGPDEFKEPLSVFSSSEKANEYVEKQRVLPNRWFDVDEYELDKER